MRHVFEVRSLLQDPGEAALAVARQVYAPGRTPCPLIPDAWQDATRLAAMRAFLGSAILPALGKAGTWGDATHYPIVTVDPQGRVTGVTTQAIATTTVDNGTCEGRLTLSSGNPVTTADVTGATTVYWSPCTGNRIALWNGSAWITDTFTEIALALGTLSSGLPYDVYAFDSAGTVTLEKLAWLSATVRATAITLQDGVYCKSGDKTRRYLGTFYTTSTTTTEDSASNRYVYNYYNRRPRVLRHYPTAASWTYGTASFRQANNDASNQVAVMVGADEDPVNLTLGMLASTSVALTPYVALGVDSVLTGIITGVTVPNTTGAMCYVSMSRTLGLGQHTIMMLEKASGATVTFYGISGGDVQTGLEGSFRA